MGGGGGATAKGEHVTLVLCAPHAPEEYASHPVTRVVGQWPDVCELRTVAPLVLVTPIFDLPKAGTMKPCSATSIFRPAAFEKPDAPQRAFAFLDAFWNHFGAS